MPLLHKWGGGYGATAQAVQTIATWSSVNQSPRSVRVPEAFFESAASRDRFASTLAGMSALYFADIVKDAGNELSRYKALEAVAPRALAMQRSRFNDTVRGIGIALCCFTGAKSEFLPALYENAEYGAVRGVAGFHVLLPRLLAELAGRAAQQIPEGQIDHLSHLLYELFANADEHGSFDSDGAVLGTAIRGIAMRHHSFSDISSYIESAGTDNPLRSYLTKAAVLPVAFGALNPTKERASEATAHFLELSVFDCGPGLPLRWLSKHGLSESYDEISPQQEMEAIQTCFRKHATTRHLSGSGQGLSQALAVMKRLKAFMVLRTGRTSVYQDFTRGDTVAFHPAHRFAKQQLSLIAGTSFTICFRIK
jgi:hypothetical protein